MTRTTTKTITKTTTTTKTKMTISSDITKRKDIDKPRKSMVFSARRPHSGEKSSHWRPPESVREGSQVLSANLAKSIKRAFGIVTYGDDSKMRAAQFLGHITCLSKSDLPDNNNKRCV
ncbi:hypothetical protein BC936DRAFT_146507, partial [Jimgerdemannia flammicorona]